MNKVLYSLLPLVLLTPVMTAEASVRKCMNPVTSTDYVVFVDGVEMGVFAPEVVRDERSRAIIRMPETVKIEADPEDVISLHLACRETFDPATQTLQVRHAVQVYTRSGVPSVQAAMESELRTLAARQEAYRASRGTYASTLPELAEFDGAGYSDVVYLQRASATGWTATAMLERHPVQCVASGGSAATVDAGEPAAIRCTES